MTRLLSAVIIFFSFVIVNAQTNLSPRLRVVSNDSLKKLMLPRPYFERLPDQSLISGEQGERYNYIVATRGKSYAFLYIYNGRNFKVNMGKISGKEVQAYWYDPRNGNNQLIGKFKNQGVMEFDPPGEKQDGNDWVLILDGKP